MARSCRPAGSRDRNRKSPKLTDQVPERRSPQLDAVAEPGIDQRIPGGNVLKEPRSINLEGLAVVPRPGGDGPAYLGYLLVPRLLVVLTEAIGANKEEVDVAARVALSACR